MSATLRPDPSMTDDVPKAPFAFLPEPVRLAAKLDADTPIPVRVGVGIYLADH